MLAQCIIAPNAGAHPNGEEKDCTLQVDIDYLFRSHGRLETDVNNEPSDAYLPYVISVIEPALFLIRTLGQLLISTFICN